jgi:AraC-like DNA-binding protein
LSRPTKDIVVVGDADSAIALLTVALRERPDVVLLDDDLCAKTPDTLWNALRVSIPSARVLLLIGPGERKLPEALATAPGLGTVSKADTSETLLSAIRRVHFGDPAADATKDRDTADDLQPRRGDTVGPFNGGLISDTRVVAVVQALNEDLRKSVSIERLARVGLGGSRLRYLFREYTGMSVTQFRKERRLQVAAHLLVSGHQRVSEIAYEIGFGDVRYFNGAFRRRFGVATSTNASFSPCPSAGSNAGGRRRYMTPSYKYTCGVKCSGDEWA